jgi:glucose-1-phosphate cytidylyltransferase
MNVLAIFCGGKGHRLKGYFGETPKQLVLINNIPLLSYIIESYTLCNIDRVVLLVGDNENQFQDFAAKYKNNKIEIVVVNTGLETKTGARLKLAEKHFVDVRNIYLCYGDIFSDVQHEKVMGFHKKHGKIATIIAVKPKLPFGILNINSDQEVVEYKEKPESDYYVNGGMFILSVEGLSRLTSYTDFENDTLTELARNKELIAYYHHGNWHGINTYKDYLELLSNINT